MKDVAHLIQKDLKIPLNYLSDLEIDGFTRAYINGQWIRNLSRQKYFSVPPVHSVFSAEDIKSCLELDQVIDRDWEVFLIQVIEKTDKFLFPLVPPSDALLTSSSVSKLLFCQLMQYISTSNYQNLWKDCYNRYPYHAVALQWRENMNIGYEEQITVLREALCRLYNCPIINVSSESNSHPGLETSGLKDEPHPSIHPAICVIESRSHFYVIMKSGNYSIQHCVDFSPAKLLENDIAPFFLLYQLLKAVQHFHNIGLFLGNITLHHMRLTDSLHTTIIPQLTDALLEKNKIFEDINVVLTEETALMNSNEAKQTGSNLTTQHRNLVPRTRVKAFLSLVAGTRARELLAEIQSLECSEMNPDNKMFSSSLTELTQLWTCHELSNLDYLLCLNYFAGHSFESSIFHPTLPWVTDFSIPNGGWRDLSRSKYRLNKGDQQLDLTYCISEPSPDDHVAHHIPEVFDEITYYIYKARQTPKDVLQRHVRNQFVPSHYPNSIARMYAWTPAECIPEFYLSPDIFMSIHKDLPDLQVPSWCGSIEKFLEYHRSALESNYVSRRLHNWIDLNFGYKLSGSASVKAKNVCLPLVDSHQDLSRGGLIQLFNVPHPPKLVPSLYLSKNPPTMTKVNEKLETGLLQGDKRLEVFDEGKAKCNVSEKARIELPSQFNPLIGLNQLELLFNFMLKVKGKIPNENIKNFSMMNVIEKIAQARRIRDMQVIGCLIVELFLFTRCRTIGPRASLEYRYKHAFRLVKNEISLLPKSLHSIVRAIFQTDNTNGQLIPSTFPSLSPDGLPAPNCHQMLQRLLSVAIFPQRFTFLYPFTIQMSQYSDLLKEAFYITCDKERDRFRKKVVEIQVKTAAHCLSKHLSNLNIDEIKIILPYILHLYEDPLSSVSAAWYLTECLGQALGPSLSKKYLLAPLLNLYQCDVVSDKHLKLFHRTFLLQILIRFGMKTFLKHLIIPLIEGVGDYKDYFDANAEDIGRNSRQIKNIRSADISLKTDTDRLSPYEDDSKSVSQSFVTSSSINKKRSSKSHSGEDANITETDNDLETFFVFDDDDDDTLEDFQDASGEGFNDQTRSLHGLDTLSFDDASLADELGNVEPSPCESPSSLSRSIEEKVVPASSMSPSAPKSITLDSKKHNISKPFTSPCSTSLPNKPQSPNLPISKEVTDRRYRRGRSEKPKLENSIIDVCSESILWLSHRLGPVLTARYLTRNLLRMLALCYLPETGALNPIPPETTDELSLTRKRVQGDKKSAKLIQCLIEIAGLYGEQMILLQYICHITELISSCEGKLSSGQEGGLVGGMVLFQEVILQLSDPVFMDQLQSTLIRGAVYPTIRLLSSMKICFPNGGLARGVIAWRIVDCIYIMALRVGRDMSMKKLTPAFTRFLNAFDKVYTNKSATVTKSLDFEQCENVLTNTKEKALKELKEVFTPELAYLSYVPLCRFLGTKFMEENLPNHDLLHSLCLLYDDNKQSDHAAVLTQDCLDSPKDGQAKVAVTGNRIDIKNANDNSSVRFGENKSIGFVSSFDISKYVCTKMENNQRHLRGNWLAYWEHETGLNDRTTSFNFKQIKLQTFIGHNNVVKDICVLDNENSFLSCSKDRTVKLWSLRSQGDGSTQCHSQWTYSHHKKSVFDVVFSEAERLVGSCDSTIHIWDPFIGKCLKQLDSLKHSPVTALINLPAPSKFMIAATTDATLKVIDLRTLSYAQELKISTAPVGLIRCLAGSGDGTLVAVAHSSGIISTLDLRNGQLLSSLKLHEGEVRSLQWVEKGIFVSSALDQTICAWNSQESKQRFVMRGPNDQVQHLRVLNSQLISGSGSNRIGVHSEVGPNASFSSTRLRSDAFKGSLTSLAVLPLNRQLLVGADNGLIGLLC